MSSEKKTAIAFLLLFVLLVAAGLIARGERLLRLLDQEGNPVVGAEVSFIPDFGKDVWITDSKGEISVGWGEWEANHVHVHAKHRSEIILDQFVNVPRFGRKTVEIKPRRK